ncbi:glycosyltransferase [Butyrivibrio sp. NC2002]|uniref:glycosyltransferase n=1 Tax=Butyrivibrio sp. NC2002 TaxID=1410610 RepID=UPI000689A346|nr:glycosyltransferase [Butyrivibrio sp. NC2002]
MNICLLNDSFPPIIDGVANVVMNYARIMTEDIGAKVIVGTPRYPGADYDNYPYKVVAYPSLDTTELVAGYRTGNPLSIRGIGQMAAFKPDIIHTHCPASSTVMARILENQVDCPIVFTYHTKFDVDIARAVGEGFLKKETIKAMVKNISACDEVWVVSEGAGENLKSLGFEGNYRVVSNGVDFPKGKASPETVKEVTSRFDLPENLPTYLFVGRIMKYKGLPLIIDALNILSQKGIDYRMIFVGGGADREELENKVKEYKIALDSVNEKGEIEHTEAANGKSGKIIFAGPEHSRERLRAYNTRADLFLFPSVYDTNGIVVREAAACGLGSVLIKGSCAAEGITDGRNGYLIDETAEAMAELLEETADKKDEMHRVGNCAMDEIYISWEDSVRDAYNRYGELKAMFDDGALQRRRKHSSDYVLETASIIIKGTNHVFDLPRNFYDGMKENFDEFKENWDELKTNINDFTDDIKGNITDFTDDIKENITDLTDDIKEQIFHGDKKAGK